MKREWKEWWAVNTDFPGRRHFDNSIKHMGRVCRRNQVHFALLSMSQCCQIQQRMETNVEMKWAKLYTKRTRWKGISNQHWHYRVFSNKSSINILKKLAFEGLTWVTFLSNSLWWCMGKLRRENEKVPDERENKARNHEKFITGRRKRFSVKLRSRVAMRAVQFFASAPPADTNEVSK